MTTKIESIHMPGELPCPQTGQMTGRVVSPTENPQLTKVAAQTLPHHPTPHLERKKLLSAINQKVVQYKNPPKTEGRVVSPADLHVTKVAVQTLPAIQSVPHIDRNNLLGAMRRKVIQCKNPPKTNVVIDKAQTDHEVNIFVQKASMYAIVSNMVDKIETSMVMKIVSEASRTNRSIYSVFFELNGSNLTFWQKITATFRYLLYFQTGILPNTLATFMETFMETLRSKLVQKEGGKNLQKLNTTLLTEINSFLVFYQKALEKFASVDPNIELQGELDCHLQCELLKKLKSSPESLQPPIDEICQQFAQTALREFLPRVPFFVMMKKNSWTIVRWLGRVLDASIGRGFNWIVRKVLEEKIPSKIKEWVIDTTDEADSSNHIFAVSITDGILEQLQKFREQLEQSTGAPHSTTTVAGAEKLPAVVQNLIEVLKQSHCLTRQKLSEYLKHGKEFHFDDLKDPISLLFSPAISKSIEESIVDGCRDFLSYLSNPSNSEEIFHRLLTLSNAPFESTPPATPQEWTNLHEKYAARKDEMLVEARELFQMVIRRSVKERFHGQPEEQVEKSVQGFEIDQRNRTNQMLGQLQKHYGSLQQQTFSQLTIPSECINNWQSHLHLLESANIAQLKEPLKDLSKILNELAQQPIIHWPDIQNLRQSLSHIESLIPKHLRKAYQSMVFDLQDSLQLPHTSINILDDLNQMVGIIDRYQYLAKSDHTDRFPGPFQKGIEETMIPVDLSMIQLLDPIGRSKKLQKDLLENASLYEELRRISQMLRNLTDINLPALITSLEHLKKLFLATNRENHILDHYIIGLDSVIPILEEQTAIALSLRTLGQKNGVLSKLGEAVSARIAGQDVAFRYKDWQNLPVLNQLPENERILLQDAISAVISCQTLPELKEKWMHLKQTMQQLFHLHWKQTLIQEISHDTQSCMRDVEEAMSATHAALQESSQEMNKEIQQLEEATNAIQIRKVESLQEKAVNALGGKPATIGMVAGTALGCFLSWFTPPWAAAVAAGAITGGLLAKKQANNDLPPSIGSIAGAAIGHAATLAVPALAPVIPILLGAVGGKIGGDLAKTEVPDYVSTEKVYPKVIDVFDNLYQFVLQRHVWQWAAFDTLKCINKTFPEQRTIITSDSPDVL